MNKGFSVNRLALYGLLIICTFCVMTNCASDNKSPTDKVNAPTQPEVDGTTKMVKLLNKAHGQIDPMKVSYFLNATRAENFKSLMSSSGSINEQLQANGQYVLELVNAGRSSEAVVEIQKLIEKFKNSGVDAKSIYGLYRLLAIGYMRLGEQDNCIGNNNSESCIIPIEGEGVYTLRQGSETAIQIYENMLKARPDDLESIWMMNIAHMTLGQYPDKVPAQWRIPLSAFNSDYDLPPFKI